MAGFLVLPLLESIGVSSGIAATAELAVSATTAEALATATTGALSSSIGSKIDEKVLEKIPKNIKETPSRIFSDYKAAAKSLISRDPRYLIEQRRSNQGYFTRKPNVSINVPNVTEQQSNDVISTSQPIIKSDTNDIYKNLYNQLSTETEIAFEPSQPEYNPYEVVSSSEMDDTKNDLQDEDYFEKKIYEEAYDRYTYSPRDLARWVIDYARDLSITKNPSQTLQNIIEMNPSFIGLTKKITTYLSDKTLPDTEEFRSISETYNFSNITYNNFSIGRNADSGLIEVTFIDEVGDVEVLPQNIGLILPSVPGTIFMGPYSINNALPNPFRVEDWASMSHDYAYYKGGYFDRIGDLKFISRLSNCLRTGRVLPENVSLVQNTIIYFSTVSLTLGMLLNGSSEKVVSEVGKQNGGYSEVNVGKEASKDDIFNVLGSPSALGMPEVNDIEYNTLRNEFYNIMKNEMKEYNKTDGYFTTAKNDYVENALLNLEITLG